MLKAVKKTTEVNKSKLKVTASTANENTNNNSNNSNSSSNKNSNNDSQGASELAIKNGSIVGQKPEGSSNDSPPLKKLSLKGNQLCGSILIGNYNYLTQLEVCENEMEVLDLSTLAQLETLKCSRNKLIELIINGTNLQTLVADHNCLQSISISKTVPLKLLHIDISDNYFSTLPQWIGGCVALSTLAAPHNHLSHIKELLRNYRISCLRSLNLSYNALQQLDYLPEAFCSVTQLQLQSNELQRLPENFFTVTNSQLSALNASCNRLSQLPRYEQNNNAALEELCLTGNQLNDNIFEPLLHAGRLKVLRLAHNRIGVLPAECVRNWPELEVLVLSGNMLQQLPDQVASLSQLKVLRCCNNLLLSTPQLAKLNKLKILDLAHNHLDRINLLSLVPSRNLKYLDLSGNQQLQVDEQQLKVCQTQSQRVWSLVDVSGNNRAALPTSTRRPPVEFNKSPYKTKAIPWSLGFAESPGNLRKLLVSQLRAGHYNNTDEALFGMFESESDVRLAQRMTQLVPSLLKQEQTLKESPLNDYLKYTLLSAQRQCGGCLSSATLFHLLRQPAKVRALKSKRYVLRLVHIGYFDAYLVRRTTHLRLTESESHCDSHKRAQTQTLPDPQLLEITLSNDDEYLVLGNDQLWSVMDIGRAAREIRKEENALLAAKRLLEIAQSFGATANLSVIVIRFSHLSTDVDHLIRELKQSVRKKPALISPQPPHLSVSKRTCCDRSNACRHRNLEQELLVGRSSPSGQSNPELLKKEFVESEVSTVAKDEFILAHARVLQEEQQLEMLDETESVLSEEQFKCWEYMLEQNTQLLFDKELNTISKSFSKQRLPAANLTAADCNDLKSSLIRNVTNKFISSSTPQLPQPLGAYQQMKQLPTEHFGSMRSFQQSPSYGYNLFDAKARDAYAKLGGGPHAAYFGSLQRRMPCNLEYDFTVTQERDHNILDEEELDEDGYNEHESRMRKYWGVATTEL
ncbi:protein phosphatase PHLPP-like protein [Drosophila grimshawi]|uniref:protein phosphatase PHLPP-like protein n=1 Tax=Drosophila grimshawi TaxID=7222 RepID=UPI001C933998|nr:protein phosphatase PHLPP-like protein [Drosophila grimshawi]